MVTENIQVVRVPVMEIVPYDFHAGAACGSHLVCYAGEIVPERLGFNQMPPKAVTACKNIKIYQTRIIGFGKFVMTGRRDQVQPPATSIAVCRTFKSPHQKTFEWHK